MITSKCFDKCSANVDQLIIVVSRIPNDPALRNFMMRRINFSSPELDWPAFGHGSNLALIVQVVQHPLYDNCPVSRKWRNRYSTARGRPQGTPMPNTSPNW